MDENSIEKSLRIRKIKEGTVIDHINAGNALHVLKILQITGQKGNIISVAMNVPSGKLKSKFKDVVKIENRELDPNEINEIALISPNATISIIRDYKVINKNRVKMPNKIHGFVNCINPNCITNSNEPVTTHFMVKMQAPLLIQCDYCNRTMSYSEIIKNLAK